MKKLLLGLVASTLMASLARAADVVKLSDPPSPFAVHDWAGLYVGANLGYGSGNSDVGWNFILQSVGLGCAPLAFSMCASGADTSRIQGTLGGFQAGYNWQYFDLVVGVESDFDLSGQRGSGNFNSGRVQYSA